MLSVFLGFTDSDYPFGIFKLFFMKPHNRIFIRNKEVLHIQTDVMLNPSHAALSESENMFDERV